MTRTVRHISVCALHTRSLPSQLRVPSSSRYLLRSDSDSRFTCPRTRLLRPEDRAADRARRSYICGHLYRRLTTDPYARHIPPAEPWTPGTSTCLKSAVQHSGSRELKECVLSLASQSQSTQTQKQIKRRSWQLKDSNSHPGCGPKANSSQLGPKSEKRPTSGQLQQPVARR